MTRPVKKVWRRMACCCPPAGGGNYVLDPECLAHAEEARLRDSFVHIEAENASLREQVRVLAEHIRFLFSLVPDWARAVPEGLDPTFYGTLSAEGDRAVKARVDAALAAVKEA